MLQQARQAESGPKSLTGRCIPRHRPAEERGHHHLFTVLALDGAGPTFLEARRILRLAGFCRLRLRLAAAPFLAGGAGLRCLHAAGAFEAEKRRRCQALVQNRTTCARMVESGCFRYTTEMVIHHTEAGSAGALPVCCSARSVAGLLRQGFSEQDLGIDQLREVARRELGDTPQTWYWSSRVRLGVV
jgi:hypothetical protein